MQTIPAGEFKTKCLKLMDTVFETHESFIITKRGKPMVKIVPIETNIDPFGFLKGTVSFKDNIVECDSGEIWEAEK